VRKNNIELIKGVDRATTTTIAALRTAVIVAQALGNQKLVLDQITALCRYRGIEPVITRELIDAACASYFVGSAETPAPAKPVLRPRAARRTEVQ